MISLVRIGGSIAIVALAGISPPSALAQSSDTSLPPVRITEGLAQLFVDDDHIAAQQGLKRTLLRPRKDQDGNPALASATVRGDSLCHKIRFEGDRALRDIAPNGIVQLRFTVDSGGALYSFTIDRDAQVLSPSVREP